MMNELKQNVLAQRFLNMTQADLFQLQRKYVTESTVHFLSTSATHNACKTALLDMTRPFLQCQEKGEFCNTLMSEIEPLAMIVDPCSESVLQVDADSLRQHLDCVPEEGKHLASFLEKFPARGREIVKQAWPAESAIKLNVAIVENVSSQSGHLADYIKEMDSKLGDIDFAEAFRLVVDCSDLRFKAVAAREEMFKNQLPDVLGAYDVRLYSVAQRLLVLVVETWECTMAEMTTQGATLTTERDLLKSLISQAEGLQVLASAEMTYFPAALAFSKQWLHAWDGVLTTFWTEQRDALTRSELVSLLDLDIKLQIRFCKPLKPAWRQGVRRVSISSWVGLFKR